jgi:cyclic pyranopterin monophosphate synthase
VSQADRGVSGEIDAQREPPDDVVEPSRRRAVARATVTMQPATATKVSSNEIAKGDVLGCARIAGIQAAKRAAELIPTALPVSVGGVVVSFVVAAEHIDIEASVEAFDRMPVSMQALTACAVAALTIYDMCKAVDRSMVIGALALWHESGGGSVDWHRIPVGDDATVL